MYWTYSVFWHTMGAKLLTIRARLLLSGLNGSTREWSTNFVEVTCTPYWPVAFGSWISEAAALANAAPSRKDRGEAPWWLVSE